MHVSKHSTRQRLKFRRSNQAPPNLASCACATERAAGAQHVACTWHWSGLMSRSSPWPIINIYVLLSNKKNIYVRDVSLSSQPCSLLKWWAPTSQTVQTRDTKITNPGRGTSWWTGGPWPSGPSTALKIPPLPVTTNPGAWPDEKLRLAVLCWEALWPATPEVGSRPQRVFKVLQIRYGRWIKPKRSRREATSCIATKEEPTMVLIAENWRQRRASCEWKG